MPAILPSSRSATISASWSSNGTGSMPSGQLVVGHPAQVDRAELLDAERAEVVLDAGAQLGRLSAPAASRPGRRDGADLGDQHQVVGVRVQGLADQRVGDVGAVVLRGVDVVDAELDGPAEHGDRRVVVARRPEDAGAGELHGAEADASDGGRTEMKGGHVLRTYPTVGKTSAGSRRRDQATQNSLPSGSSITT